MVDALAKDLTETLLEGPTALGRPQLSLICLAGLRHLIIRYYYSPVPLYLVSKCQMHRHAWSRRCRSPSPPAMLRSNGRTLTADRNDPCCAPLPTSHDENEEAGRPSGVVVASDQSGLVFGVALKPLPASDPAFAIWRPWVDSPRSGFIITPSDVKGFLQSAGVRPMSGLFVMKCPPDQF